MEEPNMLSDESRKDVMKYSLRTFGKNLLIGGLSALALSTITKKKWPSIFITGYFIGKSINESDVYLKTKINKL